MRNIPKGASTAGPARLAEARRLRGLVVAMAREGTLRDPIATLCDRIRLTAPQLHAVLWIGHDGPLTMGELARRVGVTEKTITGVVDRLEKDGHVVRERGAADRRVVRVRLSPRGDRAWRRIDAHLDARLAAVLGHLDAEDRADLFRILNKLETRLAAAAGARHAKP